MNWDAVGAIGEIIGATAVVVSLVYLAIQIRQNTNASKAATVQDMTNKWVQINLWSAESPDRVVDLTAMEPGTKEFLQGLAFYRALFHQWSNNLYQYRTGVLDVDSFKPTENEIRHIIHRTKAGPTFKVAWNFARHIYNKDFQQFFEAILQEKHEQIDAKQGDEVEA